MFGIETVKQLIELTQNIISQYRIILDDTKANKRWNTSEIKRLELKIERQEQILLNLILELKHKLQLKHN